MVKVLITGGAGFIGTNLCKKLVELGHEVTSVDNYTTGKEENHIEGVKYEHDTGTNEVYNEEYELVGSWDSKNNKIKWEEEITMKTLSSKEFLKQARMIFESNC